MEGSGSRDALDVRHQETPPLKKKKFFQFEFQVWNPVIKEQDESHDQYLKYGDLLTKRKMPKLFD